jgi:hypothetical protein
MHGFYIDEEDKSISFDIIMDFNEMNKKELYNKIYNEVNSNFKEYKVEITLDIDVSD